MPQQFVIASSSALAQFPAQDQGATQDDWYDCKPQEPAVPKLADVVLPEDQSVGVQLAGGAPKSPFVLASGGAEALEDFLVISDKAGFPRDAVKLKWGDQHTRPAHMNQIAMVMESLYKGVDWEFIMSFHHRDNWNLQTGALCSYIEDKFNEHGGYHKGCMDHLSACICLCQQWHKSTKHNKSLPDFKNKLVSDGTIKSASDYVWHQRKDDFREYCKTCQHMHPFKSGMTGCWNPAFYYGHTFCVHVKVPTFAKNSQFKDCEQSLQQMCVKHHMHHVWKAMRDCHNSEKSGQSEQDKFMNTHGFWILCKFMITEGNECFKFHDIASGSQLNNPQNGLLVNFESELTNHSKQKRFQEKHQKPDTDSHMYFNGIQLAQVPMASNLHRNPVESGSQSFTPATQAELLKHHVTGSQLAVHQGSASSHSPASAPVKQLHKFHSDESWWRTLSGFMNVAIAEQICLLPMVQQFGSLLFADHILKLTMKLVSKLAQDFNDDAAFRLVKTNSYFNLSSHNKELDEQAANDKCVCSQMCYAAYEQGDYAITCYNVTNWIGLHGQDQCNSNRQAVHDGQGPIHIQGPDGKLQIANDQLVDFQVLLVFKWNSEGVYAVKNGF